jgi:putative spermidine/putrescine transport system permease protein
VLCLGFFVIPALLGGRRDVLIAQLIHFNLTTVLNWEFAAALSTVLLVATLAIFLVAQRWFRLGTLWTEAR